MESILNGKVEDNKIIKKITGINEIENDLNDLKENENINKLKNYIKKLKNSIYGNDKIKIKLELKKQDHLKIKKEKDMLIYLFFCLKFILIIVQKN